MLGGSFKLDEFKIDEERDESIDYDEILESLHFAMDVRKARHLAKILGIEVVQPRRKGDLRFDYPDMPSCLFNHRKKTVPPVVLSFIRRVVEKQKQEKEK